MCALCFPFTGSSNRELNKSILEAAYDPIPDHLLPTFEVLLRTMLQQDPEKRPSINLILKHPLIKPVTKTILNDAVWKDEFSHTVLHKKNIWRLKPKFTKQELEKRPKSSASGRGNKMPSAIEDRLAERDKIRKSPRKREETTEEEKEKIDSYHKSYVDKVTKEEKKTQPKGALNALTMEKKLSSDPKQVKVPALHESDDEVKVLEPQVEEL